MEFLSMIIRVQKMGGKGNAYFFLPLVDLVLATVFFVVLVLRAYIKSRAALMKLTNSG